MKTLKDFTPEIKAKIPGYIERALEGVSDGGRYARFDPAKAKEAVEWNCRYADVEPPKELLVAENPYEMNIMYNSYRIRKEYGQDVNVNDYPSMLHQYNDSYLFTLNFYSDCYYTWFEFIRKEFELELSINDDFQECFRLQRASGVCQVIIDNDIAVVCKYPKRIHWNEQNQLHCTTGPAIEWGASSPETAWDDCYYINGRQMPARIFKGFTTEEFLNESEEDVRAGMYEIIESRGEGEMLKFLGAKVVHEQDFVHANGDIEHMELYKTDQKFDGEENLNGVSPAPLAWLKMTCPSTNQVYLIPTDSSFDNCMDSAIYHRPEYVTKDVPYSWEQRN